MNIEFWGDFGNGKIEKTQEFVNISRVPQVNDLFEFTIDKKECLVNVTSLRFGYKEGNFSHTEFCKAIVEKYEEDADFPSGIVCSREACANQAEPLSLYCRDHRNREDE